MSAYMTPSPSLTSGRQSPISSPFDMFAFLGLFWLAAVLLTAAVSPAIHRSKAWFAHLGLGPHSPSPTFLIIGRQTGPSPPHTLCLLQAGLIYAARVGVAGLCFLVDIYLGISAMLFEKQIHPGWSIFLAAFPYMFATCVFIRVLLFVEIQQLFNAHTSHFYCHTTNTIKCARICAILVLISGGCLLCLEAWIVAMLYMNKKSVRNLSKSQTDSRYGLPIFYDSGPSQSCIVLEQGTIGGFTVAVGKATFNSWSVMLPTGSILAALVFGTQMDILKVWMFWRKNPTDDGVSSLEIHCQGCDCFVSSVWYERHVILDSEIHCGEDHALEYTTRTVKTRSSRQTTSLEGAETSTSKIDWKRQTFEIAGSTRKIAQMRTKRAAFSSSRYWTWLDQEEYRVKYEAEMDRTWTVYSYDGTILATFTAYTRRFLRDNSMPVLSVSESITDENEQQFLILILLYSETKRLESLRERPLSPYVFVILDLFLVPNIRPDIRTELAAGIIGTTMFSHLGQFYVAARRRFSMAIYTSALKF
ncbi:hypothetical protein B0H14DRAFT_3446751 [Mycena olivaceomarginata]|nr:hypothetical protein B0H14DRAFT_3446751 [Mycena olivaceomarginata]